MTEGVNPKDLVGATKAPLALVPPALVIGAAEALATGRDKYGAYNWRDYPVQAVTYVEAAMRHLLAYMDGEDYAADTQVHHVKHAVAGLGVLLDCIAMGTVDDNRPLPGPAAKLLDQQDGSKTRPERIESKYRPGEYIEVPLGADVRTIKVPVEVEDPMYGTMLSTKPEHVEPYADCLVEHIDPTECYAPDSITMTQRSTICAPCCAKRWGLFHGA